MGRLTGVTGEEAGRQGPRRGTSCGAGVGREGEGRDVGGLGELETRLCPLHALVEREPGTLIVLNMIRWKSTLTVTGDRWRGRPGGAERP